ncbi:Dynein heavy chain 6, axonemal [Coelomomyces lativittatus]|nr:Dynein heavy chain 6, axonemal [Coelomomyces lativittatus]
MNDQHYDLAQFITIQKEHIEIQVKHYLTEYDQKISLIATEACKQALIAANCEVDPEKVPSLTFTQQAARRTECRYLERFIKLIDYLKLHTLHLLVVNSTRDFLRLLMGRCTDQVLATETDSTLFSEETDQLLEWVPTSCLVMAGYEAFAGRVSKLTRAHANEPSSSLDIILTILTSFPSPRQSPLFRMELLLVDTSTSISPTLADLTDTIDHLSKAYITSVEKVGMLTNSIDFLVQGQSFEEPDFTEGPNLSNFLSEDTYYLALIERTKLCLVANFHRLQEFCSAFIVYRDMYIENQNLDLKAIEAGTVLFPSVDPTQKGLTTSFFEQSLALYANQIEKVKQLPSTTVIMNFLADITLFKEKILPSSEHCFKVITDILPPLARDKNETLLNELNASIKVLSSQPLSVVAFVEYLQKLDSVKLRMSTYDALHQEVSKLYSLMDLYKLHIVPTDLAMFQTLRPSVRQLKEVVDVSEETKEENVNRFSNELERQFSDLLTQVNEVKVKCQDPMLLDPASNVNLILDFLNELNTQLEGLVKTAEQYTEYQAQFKVPQTRYPVLEEAKQDLDLKISLWKSFKQWEILVQTWDETPFEKINTEEMGAQINLYLKTVYNLNKGLPPNDVVPKLKNMVENYRSMLSTIIDLRNPALKTRHWDKIQDTVGKSIARDETLCLPVLREANVFKFKEEIMNISAQASSEAALEELLQKLVRTWADTEFIILPYRDTKDVFILGGVEDIQTLLEDSQTL